MMGGKWCEGLDLAKVWIDIFKQLLLLLLLKETIGLTSIQPSALICKQWG